MAHACLPVANEAHLLIGADFRLEEMTDSELADYVLQLVQVWLELLKATASPLEEDAADFHNRGLLPRRRCWSKVA